MTDWATEQYLVMVLMNNTQFVHTVEADNPEEAVKKIKHDKLSPANLEQLSWIRAIKIGDIPEIT